MRVLCAGVAAGVLSVTSFVVTAVAAAPLPTKSEIGQAAGIEVSVFERYPGGFHKIIDGRWKPVLANEYAQSADGDTVDVRRYKRVNGTWRKYRAHEVANLKGDVTNFETLAKTKRVWSFRAEIPRSDAPSDQILYGQILFTPKASGQRMVRVGCLVDAGNTKCAARVARLYK